MSAATVESRSPQAPDDLVIEAPAADRAAVERAFESARAAAAEWSAAPANERANALFAAADALAGAEDELVSLMVREVGKPLAESKMELPRAVAILRFHAGAALLPDGVTHPRITPAPATTLTTSRRRPRGVAGLITPWNFPLAIPLWKAAPALAYGNGVVLKPSPEATACAIRLGELVGERLPDGLLCVVPGDGEAGEAVVALADVVSFTGSTKVGRAVARAAAERGVAVQCEMGGLNSSIVLPDADLESAAKAIAGSIMGYAGQKCTATRRVLAVGNAAELTDALKAAVEALPVGDPAQDDTQVGPVIREQSQQAVVEAGAGGRVVTGGERLSRDGWFVAPTLVDSLEPDAVLAREEVFGPVAAIMEVGSAEEAARLDASVPYGLVTSVFTGDLSAALWLGEHLRTGMIRVNLPTTGVDFHAPFGGEGASSYGPREQGLAARELYTSTHTTAIAPTS
jgi:alpha-ketoglutaric semialdehyde dehydrogenase